MTVTRSRAHPWLRLLLLWAILASVISLAACSSSETAEGKVIDFRQTVPLAGGLVESLVVVELDDGREVRASLPQDDALWTELKRGSNVRVEIRRDGSGEPWQFVRILDD